MVIADLAHHITQRGDNRAQVFREDADRRLYLDEDRVAKTGLLSPFSYGLTLPAAASSEGCTAGGEGGRRRART